MGWREWCAVVTYGAQHLSLLEDAAYRKAAKRCRHLYGIGPLQHQCGSSNGDVQFGVIFLLIWVFMILLVDPLASNLSFLRVSFLALVRTVRSCVWGSNSCTSPRLLNCEAMHHRDFPLFCRCAMRWWILQVCIPTSPITVSGRVTTNQISANIELTVPSMLNPIIKIIG